MSDLFVDLDRSSPVPLYFQVARQIERAIEAGELPPGSRLDNEITLADRLGLSRPTMRRAIQQLVDKGLLVRKRGVGTQVVHGQVTRPVELTSLHDDLAAHGQAPTTRVLVHEVVEAGDEVAAGLAVPVGQPVLHLRRLRSSSGEPLALLENWLPHPFTDLTAENLAERGLYQLLRSRGVGMRVARQRIGARRGSAEECQLLDERRGSPLLTMERTVYDDSGHAVEWGRHVYRASRYAFEVTLVDR
ncbi:GntR family transcriptional regulator [Kineococcus sp. SYSU DK004]|uniref:GntR family transcriptional regulator n=1 Tax=Kineococcus sp. SYSU DK004 TaxID=3383125 RepID=UPI003D7C9229